MYCFSHCFLYSRTECIMKYGAVRKFYHIFKQETSHLYAWAKLQNTRSFWSASLTCVGRLWRSRHNTIDAILIQWHVNQLRGILKLLPKKCSTISHSRKSTILVLFFWRQVYIDVQLLIFLRLKEFLWDEFHQILVSLVEMNCEISHSLLNNLHHNKRLQKWWPVKSYSLTK